MEKRFQFIDASKNDRVTRRLARSHAMKGKNLGKKHQRRSKQELYRLHTYKENAPLQIVSESKRSEERTHDSLDMKYGVLSIELLPAAFPIEASLQSQLVINQFYTIVVDALYLPQLCRSLEAVRLKWMQGLFINETSYHCSLALMASLSDVFFGKEGVSLRAIFHLNQAIVLVNQKLNTSEALADSNFAVVNALIVQEIFCGTRQKADVHMNGLQKMVQLRGGLSQLGQDGFLILKICKTDIDYALNYGTSTSFYRDRMPEIAVMLASERFLMRRALTDSGSAFLGIDSFLQQILQDISEITSLFNSREYSNFKLDPHILQEIVISVGYRLVRFYSLSGPLLENKLESAYHIGLTAFITTLFMQFNNRRFLKYRLVAEYLKDVIDRGLAEEDNELLLWLLFVGGVSVFEELDHPWLISKISQSVRRLRLRNWEQVHQYLVTFPWINSLHDAAGMALWNLALATSS